MNHRHNLQPRSLLRVPSRRTLMILLCVVTAHSLSGCVYFNTFYNTRKYFREAIDENRKRTSDRPTPKERQKFDATISQASKILALHPDSKYVDDSLFMIGQSFYYLEQYRKAERKFAELLELFPDSEFAGQARLWQAKTRIRLKAYLDAETALTAMIQSTENKDLARLASYWMAESKFEQGQFQVAVDSYQRSIEGLKDNHLQAEAYLRLGAAFDSLGTPERAAEAYQKAAKKTKDINRKFAALLSYGRTIAASGQYKAAESNFRELIARYPQLRELSSAKAELAHTIMAQGDVEGALEMYNDIIDAHPRTPGAAVAFYALAQYDETVYQNFEAAEESYRRVAEHDAKNELAPAAKKRSAAIKQLMQLESEISELADQIETAKKGPVESEDSTATPAGEPALVAGAQKAAGRALLRESDDMLDAQPGMEEVESKKSARRKTEDPRQRSGRLADSRNLAGRRQATLNNRRNTPRRAGARSPAANKPADPDSLTRDLVAKKFEIAELFLFEFARPDSARNLYLDILAREKTEENRAFAFYSLAYLYDQFAPDPTVRDSIYQILALNYADTEHGTAAARRLGMEVNTDAATRQNVRLNAAQTALIEGDTPLASIQQLESLLTDMENPVERDRVLFLIGWGYEHRVQNYDSAYAWYKRLVEAYPRSAYVRDVRGKVAAVERTASADSSQQDVFAAADDAALAQQRTTPTAADSSQGYSLDDLPRPPSRRARARDGRR